MTVSSASFEELLAQLDPGPPVSARLGPLRLGSAFQPIFSLSHGRVVGHEALLRATGLDGQPVSPYTVFNTGNHFAELVHRDRLSRLVHVANYMGHGAPPDQWLFLNVHPEVAALSLDEPGGNFRERALRHFGLPPQLLVIELTEEAMRDDAAFETVLNSLRAAGCLVAIDDFGAGHSNFDRVWRWRPEIVKLDRLLVTRAARDPAARRVVVQMVQLLHECGSLVLMEGVETEDQAEVALEADADLVQGHHFARPLAQPLGSTPDTVPGELMQAWDHFDAHIDRQRDERREHNEPYCRAIALAAARLATGRPMDEACKAFLGLPNAQLCYLLASNGRQRGATQRAPTACRDSLQAPQPLQYTGGARWSRRPYFRRALGSPGTTQVTRPYRTLNGGALCITVSTAFRNDTPDGGRETLVICGDLLWRD